MLELKSLVAVLALAIAMPSLAKAEDRQGTSEKQFRTVVPHKKINRIEKKLAPATVNKITDPEHDEDHDKEKHRPAKSSNVIGGTIGCVNCDNAPGVTIGVALELESGIDRKCERAELYLPGTTADPDSINATKWAKVGVNVSRKLANVLAFQGHIVSSAADWNVVESVEKNPSINPNYHPNLNVAINAVGGNFLSDYSDSYCSTYPDPQGFAHHISKLRSCEVELETTHVGGGAFYEAIAMYSGCYNPSSRAHKPVINEYVSDDR